MQPAEHRTGAAAWAVDRDAVLPAAQAAAHVYADVLAAMTPPGNGALARDHATDSAEGSLFEIERLAERAAATVLLDHVAFAVIAVDERASIRFANAPASRLLAAGSRLVLQNGVLHVAQPEEHAALCGAIAAATRPLGIGIPAEWLRLTADDGQPFGVLVLPAISTGRESAQVAPRHGPPLTALAVLVLTDPDREQALRAVLRSLFGLTRAEGELALLLLHGLGIEDAARIRRITTASARAAWQSVAWKTGTDGSQSLRQVITAALIAPVGGLDEGHGAWP